MDIVNNVNSASLSAGSGLGGPPTFVSKILGYAKSIFSGVCVGSAAYACQTGNYLLLGSCLTVATIAGGLFARGSNETETQAPALVSRYESLMMNKRDDFIRRINGSERKNIVNKLETLPDLKFAQLQAFKEGSWDHAVFSLSDWPHLALRSYLDKELDIMEVSKLFLFARVQSGGRAVRVVGADGHKTNRYQLFDKSYSTQLGEAYQLKDNRGEFDRMSAQTLLKQFPMNLNQAKQLPHMIAQLASVDTQFFVVPVAPLLSGQDCLNQIKSGKTDIYNALLQDGFSLFLDRDSEKRGVQLVVVPPPLYSALLKAQFGLAAINPSPILGYSAKEILSDVTKRVQGIPCPFVAMPKTIHHVIDASDPLAFYYHDQVHAFIDSGNPHRQFWTDLALSFKKTDPELYVTLLDRNFPLYSTSDLHFKATGRENLNREEIFWYGLPFLATFEPGIWDGSQGDSRMKSILSFFHKRNVSLNYIEKLAEQEPIGHHYSLAPWVKIAKTLFYK